jgi:peptidoglycan/xylan/chitin deacetylase (PgdA/CDA1 family)
MRAEGIASPRLAWRGAGIPGVLSLFQNLETTVVPTPQGWRVAEGGPLDPAAPVIPPRQVAPRVLRVPILMYHHISSAPPAPSQAGLTITDPDFAAQLAYLKGHGYHAVLLVDLFNALYDDRPLPPHPVVLTFDDGYLDAYTDAFPLLRRYGMVGEFNIITGFVGKTIGLNRYMTWSEIVAMAGAGMEMESHTIDHQDLGIFTAPQDAYELRFSRAVLAAHLHRAVQFLAYPSGEPFRSGTVAAQQRLLALLPQFGYVGGLLDPPVPSTLQDARMPYQLRRIRVDPGESLAAFAPSLQW